MPRTPQPPNPQNSYLPRLPGVGPEVQRVVQDLWTAVRDSVAQTQNLIERPTWTKAQLDAKYSPAAISQALSYGGSQQLNVNGLPGLLLQPQTAAVTALTVVPSNTPGSDPLNQTGTLISVNGQLMIYSGTAWVALTVLGSVLQDTHANRTNYLAPSYALGVLYHEIDRTVFYEVTLVGGVNVWTYSFGVMIAATASRPADLGANDVGFMFLDSTLNLFEHWDGGAWVIVAATTAVAPAVYGSATTVPQITLDAEGRITAAVDLPITFPGTAGFSGTVTPVVSITVVNGLVTAVS